VQEQRDLVPIADDLDDSESAVAAGPWANGDVDGKDVGEVDQGELTRGGVSWMSVVAGNDERPESMAIGEDAGISDEVDVWWRNESGDKMNELVPEQTRQGFSMVYKGSCEKGNLDPKLYECLMAAKDYDTMSQCDQ
jgi:hypothetical protein